MPDKEYIFLHTPPFKILLHWNELDNAFPHIFMIEFASDSATSPLEDFSRTFTTHKRNFVKYLIENFGEEPHDWMIAKHSGPHNYGAALMVGFRDKNNAAAFILENS